MAAFADHAAGGPKHCVTYATEAGCWGWWWWEGKCGYVFPQPLPPDADPEVGTDDAEIVDDHFTTWQRKVLCAEAGLEWEQFEIIREAALADAQTRLSPNPWPGSELTRLFPDPVIPLDQTASTVGADRALIQAAEILTGLEAPAEWINQARARSVLRRWAVKNLDRENARIGL